MPYKDKDKAKENNKRWRLRHKEEISAKAKIRRVLEDKDRRRAYHRKYYHTHLQKMREYGRTKKNRLYRENPILREHYKLQVKKKRIERRLICLTHYSKGSLSCACCGEASYQFLSLDHINGNGHKHRLEIGGSGSTLFDWLIKKGFPEGYRVLCYNCNCSEGYYGYCPHNKATSEIVGS